MKKFPYMFLVFQGIVMISIIVIFIHSGNSTSEVHFLFGTLLIITECIFFSFAISDRGHLIKKPNQAIIISIEKLEKFRFYGLIGSKSYKSVTYEVDDKTRTTEEIIGITLASFLQSSAWLIYTILLMVAYLYATTIVDIIFELYMVQILLVGVITPLVITCSIEIFYNIYKNKNHSRVINILGSGNNNFYVYDKEENNAVILNLTNGFYDGIKSSPTATDLQKNWINHMKQYEKISSLCVKDYAINGYNWITETEKTFIDSYKRRVHYMYIADMVEKVVSEFLNTIKRNSFIKPIKVDVVVYHGLWNAAGWATSIDGKRTVLLGIEKIIELGWDNRKAIKELISHELSHIIHGEYREDFYEEIKDPYQRDVMMIYVEGFAMYYQNKLAKQIYYSRGEDWIKNCKDSILKLKKEYLLRLQDSKQTCKDFFGDWWNVFGISDSGYYLGMEFIERLMSIYEFEEVLVLPFSKINNSLIKYLNNEKIVIEEGE